MSQIVTIPGIGEATFPDDMSPDQIEAALNEQFGDKSQPEAPAPIQKPPTELTRTNRFGESLGQLRQEAEKVRGEAMLGNLAETGIDLAQRVVGTVAEMPSAPLNLMRRVLPTQPIVSPEQGESVARFLNPFPAPEGSLARGIEKGAGELISGTTDPLVAAQIALGYRWPTQIAKGFQAQMLLGAPEAGKQLTQAETPEELGKGLISYGSALGFPLLIEAGLLRSARMLPEAAAEAARTVPSSRLSPQEQIKIIEEGTEERSTRSLRPSRPVVPEYEEPMEAYETSPGDLAARPAAPVPTAPVKEIATWDEAVAELRVRGKGNETRAEIQQLLPEISLSKEAAGKLGRAAWGNAWNPTVKKKGVPDASSIEEAAAVHGDVRSQPGQSQGEMPIEEGGKGIQPQAARRVEEKAQVLLTKFRITRVLPNMKRGGYTYTLEGEDGTVVNRASDFTVDRLRKAGRIIEPETKLTPDEQAYLDAERKGMDVDVQVTPTLPGDQPFAGQIATIDRANNRILVNPQEFSGWLGKVAEKDRAKAVKSLLSEERLHLAADDASALGYWNTLTATEKLAQRRRYTGNWRGLDPTTGQALPDVLMGHEALRFRLQQLARITPREIAETNWLSREGFTVRSITALESAVRAVRETLGTKASSEAIAILDRVQGNLDAAKAVLAGSQEPAALRKKQLQDTKQENLLLPPVAETAGLERGAPKPSALEVERNALELERIAQRHVDEAFAAGKIPDFEAFRGGVGLDREKLFYLWQDAILKRLPTLKGKEVERYVEELKLVKDIAEGLKPGEKEPRIGGAIPDPQVFTRGQQIVMPTLGKVSKAQYARQMAPEQRRRHAAIAGIFDKLMQKAGPKPEKPWTRATIGREDIRQMFYSPDAPPKAFVEKIGVENIEPPTVVTKPMYRRFLPEEARDPAIVGKIATTGASIEASGKGAPPRTVSRNVMAIQDRTTGRVVLVNAFKDPQTKRSKVTNPAAAHLAAENIDAWLLERYKPISVMSLRDPVKNFRQVFDSLEAFHKEFGDVAIEGTPGLRTSSFAGPERGIVEGQAGLARPTSAPRPETLENVLLRDIEAPVSPTARELTKRERLAPTVVRGETLPKEPGPEPKLPAPKEPEMLPGPLPNYQQFEAETIFKEPSYGKPTGQIVESAVRPGRKIQTLQPGTLARMGVQPELGKRMPAALAKQQLAAEYAQLKNAVRAMIVRRKTKADMPRLLDAEEGLAGKFGIGSEQRVIIASHKPLPPGLSQKEANRQFKANEKEAVLVRNAVKAVIATGTIDKNGQWKPQRNLLKDFHNKLDIAEAKADAMAQSVNPIMRYAGKRWRANVEKLREELNYANAHWNDTELINATAAARQEFSDTIAFENANGRTVKDRQDYVPGRYEGEFWSDNGILFAGRKILGGAYRFPKRFNNYYEAAMYGPYIPASYDIAALVRNRVTSGHRTVARSLWLENLKLTNDPDSLQPIGANPIPIYEEKVLTDQFTGQKIKAKVFSGRYQSPGVEYKLVYPGAGNTGTPVAVREGYAPLAKTLLAPSFIEEAVPGGKQLLRYHGMLKHGVILLLDTFHPGRIGQYALALSGFREWPSWRNGKTALKYRPQDLPDAVAKGFVTQEQADWALRVETIGGSKMNHMQILDGLVGEALNVARLSDALYKDAIQQVPILGGAWHKAFGWYNRWLFEDFIPGLMAENAVRRVVSASKKYPNTPARKIMADVAKDINVFYGNMGRQGLFKSKTFFDLVSLISLAPAWQEGLLFKELKGATRFGLGAAREVGLAKKYRKDLPALGALGTALGKGLATYFVATQLINLVTRGKFTWQNEEEGHKLDAAIPIGDGRNLWLSPLSVFAEVTHDVQRMLETKDKAWDALLQIGENRMGPFGKMAVIGISGKSPLEQQYSTTPGIMWGMASQAIPLAGASPISFSVPGRALAHAVAPNVVSPNAPGAVQRQMMASAFGIKVNVSTKPAQQIGKKAKDFMRDNNLLKSTGWEQVMTDEASYAKMRTALRNDDYPEAKHQFNELLKQNRTPQLIYQKMSQSARRPFTGSHSAERMFKYSLNEKELEMYSQAQIQRMEELAKFREFYYRVLAGD